MIENFTKDNLQVVVHHDSKEVGKAAADFVEKKLSNAIEEKGRANLILATGASQFSFLKALKAKKIDWQKIIVFHLDEYKDISDTHPASFRRYLKERILNAVVPQAIYFLNGDAKNLEQEMKNYTKQLIKHPIDVACIGIGENGHIAFNDPPVADFNDTQWVKLVKLDATCRKQQLGEGWFPSLEAVPMEALTLTIPAIMSCKAISCVVPDLRKAEAVYNTLNSGISTDCPATILRTHPEAVLFLDTPSATQLKN